MARLPSDYVITKGSLTFIAFVFAVSCTSDVPRTNQFDPDGTGPRAPGRIAGEVSIDGLADMSGVVVHVFDDQNTEASTTTTDAAGSFLSGTLAPGEFHIDIDVPVENQALSLAKIEVLPGATTDIGRIVSALRSPSGQISGRATLQDSSESLANTMIVASRDTAVGSDTHLRFTNANGEFSFSDLYPGSWRIRADRDGFTPDHTVVAVAADDDGGTARALSVAPDMKLYPASAAVLFSVPTTAGHIIGARFTNTQNVSLLLLAFGGVNEMRVSEAANFIEGDAEVPWREHIGQIDIALSDGEGLKTVYAQFRAVDVADPTIEYLRTETYEAQVIVDKTPPAVVAYTVGTNAREVGGKRYVTDDLTAVPVEIVAVDAFSGISGIKWVVENADPDITAYELLESVGPNLSYNTTVALSPGDGEKVIAVQLRDGAGNEGPLLAAAVVVDTTPPAILSAPGIGVAPSIGNQVTSDEVVLRCLVGADSAQGIDGPVTMRYGIGPLPASDSGAAVAFEPERRITLTAVDGDNVQFWAVLYDAAGNDLRLETPVLTMNLLGDVVGRVYVEDAPDSAVVGHEGTTISLFELTADPLAQSPGAPLFGPVATTGDGGYTLNDVTPGIYQVLFARADYVSALQAPVEVRAAESTLLSLQRLNLARGGVSATFEYGSHAAGASHAGIKVEAWRGLVLEGTAFTDDGGQVVFSGLRVGDYVLRGSAEGFLRQTGPATAVVTGQTTPVAGVQTLTKLLGDFKICASADAASPPGTCTPILYTRDTDVLLGLQQDPASATHLRFVLSGGPVDETAFLNPANVPSSDAGCVGTECWQSYDPTARYTVDITLREGLFEVVVQFANADSKQPVGLSRCIRDTHAPTNATVDIMPGSQSVLPGLTNSSDLSVTLRADERAPSDPWEVSPLDVVRLSRTASWAGVGGPDGEELVTYGASQNAFTVDAGFGGAREVHAWFCDSAGNCSAGAVDSIELDLTTPDQMLFTPQIDATVRDKTSEAGTWWTRSTSYVATVVLGDAGYELDLGAAAPYAVPDVTAYQLSLSPTFLGTQWILFDLSLEDATSTVSITGVGLPATEMQHRVYARFRDAAGNISATNNIVLELDTTAPWGTVTLEGGASLTNKVDPSQLAVQLTTDDAVEIQTAWDMALPDPVAGLRIAYPAAGALGGEFFVATELEGLKTLNVRFFDEAGNYSVAASSITLDVTGPTLGAATLTSLSGISGFTASVDCLLNLSANGADALLVDGDLIVPAIQTWMPSVPTVAVQLSAGDGSKQVVVSLRDAAANASVPASLTAKIYLDLLSPIVDPAVLGVEPVVINAGDTHTNSRTVMLSLSSDDGSGSGVVDMAVGNGSVDCGTAIFESFAPTRVWALPPGDYLNAVVSVCYRDLVGNVAGASDSITLDQTPPDNLILNLDAGAPYSRDTVVTADFSAQDAFSAASKLDIRLSLLSTFAGATWATNLSSPQSVTLPAMEGAHAVHMQVRDEAGNVAQSSCSVMYDGSAPGDGTVTLNGGDMSLSSTTMSVLVEDTAPDKMYIWEVVPAGSACGAPACSDVGFKAFSPASTFTLGSTDLGNKRVCWRFCDDAGNASSVGQSDPLLTLGTYLDRPTPALDSITPFNHLALAAEGNPEPNYTLTVSGRGIAFDTQAEIGDFLLPCSSSGANDCGPDTGGGCGIGGLCEATCAESCTVDLPDSIMRNVGTYVVRLLTPSPVEAGASSSANALFFSIIAPQPRIESITPKGVFQSVINGAPVGQTVSITVLGDKLMDNVEFRLGSNYGLVTSFTADPSRGPTASVVEVSVNTDGLMPSDDQDLQLVAVNPAPGGGEHGVRFGLNPDPTWCTNTPCVSNMRASRTLSNGALIHRFGFVNPPAGPVAFHGGDAVTILDEAGKARGRVSSRQSQLLPFAPGFDRLQVEARHDSIGSGVAFAEAVRRNDLTFNLSANSPVTDALKAMRFALGDLDDDGQVDMVIADESGNEVLVYIRSAADGYDTPPTAYPMATGPRQPLLMDTNGDGDLDIVSGSSFDRLISVRLAMGDGTFGPRADYPATLSGNAPQPIIRAADLNNDLVPDFVGSNGNSLTILMGVGDGSFGAESQYALRTPSSSLRHFELVDVTGDGFVDVVGTGGPHVSVFPGYGDGSFPSVGHADVITTTFPGALYLSGFQMGDVNLDGALDIVVVDAGDHDPPAAGSVLYKIDVMLGLGDGRFDTDVAGSPSQLLFQHTQFGQMRPDVVALGDVNGDGFLDAAVGVFWRSMVAIFIGNGDGTFANSSIVDNDYTAVTTVPTPDGITEIALVDLDLDGALDLVSHARSQSVSILNGGGTPFLQETTSMAARGLIRVQAVDFDRDGMLDLHVPETNFGKVGFGVGDRTFETLTTLNTGNMKVFAGLLDADGDGYTDILNNSNYSATRHFYVNLYAGARTFNRVVYEVEPNPASPSAGLMFAGVAVGDVNLDGRADLVMGASGDAYFYHWQDAGDGHYYGTCAGDLCLSDHSLAVSQTAELELADLNRDGQLDLIVGGSSGTIEVHLATGLDGSSNPTYAAPVSVVVFSGWQRKDLIAADINSDGWLDIVNVRPDTLSCLINTTASGTFGFGPPTDIALGSDLRTVIARDFNGDGIDDLLVADGGQGNVFVLYGDGSANYEVTHRYALGTSVSPLEAADFDGDGISELVVDSDGGGATFLFKQDGARWWPLHLTNENVSVPLPAGTTVLGAGTAGVSQAPVRIDQLAVTVRAVGTSLEGLTFSVRAPDGRVLLLRDNAGCGPDLTGLPIYQAHFPTASSCADVSFLEGWQPAGTWELIVANDGSSTAGLEDFGISMRASFKQAVGDGNSSASPRVLRFSPGTTGRVYSGHTFGATDDHNISCTSTQGDVGGDGTNDAGDAWYEFSLPAANTIDAKVMAGFDAAVEVRSGACAAAGAVLACDDNSYGGFNPAVGGLSLAAGTYCLIVDGVFDSSGTPTVAHTGYYSLFLTFASAL